jgi:KUP system potassium uptake protein
MPDLPAALRLAKERGCATDLEHAVFFAARDNVVARRPHKICSRVLLFAFMPRNSVHAVDRFLIPAPNFVEIERRVEV